MAVRLASRRRPKRSLPLSAWYLVFATLVTIAMILRRERPAPVLPSAPIVAGFDMVTIPVPAEYVPAGKNIRDIHFRSLQFPAQQVPQGAITSLGDLGEGVTAAPLPANLPLFKENFTHSGAAINPVVERIPPGMRAMTIRVDATSSVEGWAGSGSIVDVLMVESDRTTVVAEKVKVLSAERSVSPIEGAAAPSVPSTVTLLVTQEQCLAINTAIPRGRIAFALRSAKDDEVWESTTFTAERLKGLAGEPDRRAAVNGYAEVAENGRRQSFALSGGKWMKSGAVPDGFLVNSRRGEP